MGAFDTVDGKAACPRCGSVLWICAQSKFFLPSFQGIPGRWFKVGVPQPLDFDPGDLFRGPLWDDSWIRIRPDRGDGRIALLAGSDELFSCSCDAPLASIFVFRVEASAGKSDAGTATLEAILLREAFSDDLASQVDFADGEDLVTGYRNVDEFWPAARALAAASMEERTGALRAAMLRRFGDDATAKDAPSDADDGWTRVEAPVRCEACGDVRVRRIFTMLTHPHDRWSFFGDASTPGILQPGTRIRGDLSWLGRDERRGRYLRLRSPSPPGSLVVLGDPESWGCACGAGRASVVLRFTLSAGALELDSVTLRVVRSAADLSDVDFAHGPYNLIGYESATREELIGLLIARLDPDG